MVRLLSFIFIAFIFSCTIIEDSDITSQEELDNLVYSSIEIKQETTTGTTTSTIALLYDSVIDATDTNTGAHIVRKQRYSLPLLTSKLKLRSETTTGTEVTITYLENNKPYTVAILKEDSLVERYRFRYSDYTLSGKLNRIVTFLNPVDNLPFLSNTGDTLIFDTSGNLTRIDRESTDDSKDGTFTGIESRTSSSSEYLVKFILQGMEYEIPCQGGGCGSYWGGNYHVESVATQFPVGVMNLNSTQKAYLSIEDFNNINQSFCGSSNCDAWIDTFYFHPLMMLKDNFEIGDDLLFIYMVDWWAPTSTQESSNNEKVTFTFNYDL